MRSLFVLSIMTILVGCIPPQVNCPPPASLSLPEAEFQNATNLVRQKRYSDAHAVYRKIAADSPQSSIGIAALFELSYLLVVPENPQKDYALALQGFETFVKLHPDHPKAQDAETWRAVLKLVLDTKKENDHLNKSIEQLKKLDIRHEEKRGK